MQPELQPRMGAERATTAFGSRSPVMVSFGAGAGWAGAGPAFDGQLGIGGHWALRRGRRWNRAEEFTKRISENRLSEHRKKE